MFCYYEDTLEKTLPEEPVALINQRLDNFPIVIKKISEPNPDKAFPATRNYMGMRRNDGYVPVYHKDDVVEYVKPRWLTSKQVHKAKIKPPTFAIKTDAIDGFEAKHEMFYRQRILHDYGIRASSRPEYKHRVSRSDYGLPPPAPALKKRAFYNKIQAKKFIIGPEDVSSLIRYFPNSECTVHYKSRRNEHGEKTCIAKEVLQFTEKMLLDEVYIEKVVVKTTWSDNFEPTEQITFKKIIQRRKHLLDKKPKISNAKYFTELEQKIKNNEDYEFNKKDLAIYQAFKPRSPLCLLHNEEYMDTCRADVVYDRIRDWERRGVAINRVMVDHICEELDQKTSKNKAQEKAKQFQEKEAAAIKYIKNMTAEVISNKTMLCPPFKLDGIKNRLMPNSKPKYYIPKMETPERVEDAIDKYPDTKCIISYYGYEPKICMAHEVKDLVNIAMQNGIVVDEVKIYKEKK